MRLSSLGGIGAGSRMVVLNPVQWTGNYIASGITSISMDVNDFGASDLYFRVLFENPMGLPPVDVAATTNAIFLAAGSGWTHVTFWVAAADLTAGSVNTVLLNTTLVRLYDSQSLTFPGTTSVVSSGADNIAAAGVPEPGPWGLLAGGVALLVVGGLRRRRP